MVGSSAQALIAADLGSGAIDLGTSLVYRAWALFADARLPERYDAAPSLGRDTSLFADIAASLPDLTGEQRAALAPFLRRPTDPASAWSAGPEAGAGGGAELAAFTAADEPNRCAAPRTWWSMPWSPDGDPNHGVVVYACGLTKDTVNGDLNAVVSIVQRLWPKMTGAVPQGMGLPIEDTGVAAHEADGKLDIYLLDPLARCRPRGDACDEITGVAVAITVPETDACKESGPPKQACPAYMLLGRERLAEAELPGDFAHEFFHVLQFAHNGSISRSWYLDATATWAEWQYVVRSGDWTQAERDATRDNLTSLFDAYQDRSLSLLRSDPDPESENRWEYEAWLWPLFQSVRSSPTAIPTTWSALEGAKDLAAADRIIDGDVSFTSDFHEFAVWNAQPADYTSGSTTGLEAVSWQTKPNLGWVPLTAHKLKAAGVTIGIGKQLYPTGIEQLAAQYDTFRVTDEKVRQVTIDISKVRHADTADLDVLAQLEPGAGQDEGPWRRFTATDGRVTLCRDDPAQRVAILEVVISNHDFTRAGDLVPKDNNVSEVYSVEGKDRCDVPLGFEGTFSGSNSGDYSWTGTARFELMEPDDPAFECSLDPGIVEYCYRFVSGQATWTWPAGHGENSCPGGTTSDALSQAAGDDGVLHLLVASDEEPEAAGSYGGPIIAGLHQGGSGCTAHNAANIVAWMSMGSPAPRYGAGYQLSGSYSHSGCGVEGCGTQSWEWDLTPFFGP